MCCIDFRTVKKYFKILSEKVIYSEHMKEQFSVKGLWKICFVTTVLSLWLLIQLSSDETSVALIPHTRIETYLEDKSLPSGFLVNNNGCRIPDLDIFSPTIQNFIYDEEETNCAELYGMPLVESNLTTLFINESALAYYNITDISDLRCCYTPFWRVELKEKLNGKYPSNVDTKIRFARTCTQFSDQVPITDEFIKTECFLNSSASNKPIYTDFHAFTPIKNNTRREGYDQLREDSVSVLILGVDAVSRLNLHRQMPLTLKFLKQNLSAVELLGYNKVADNTFPNLIPVFTGLSEEELKQSCWPSGQSVFDNCNYIWDQFSASGYTTAFAEDASWMGIFSYVKKGFRKQPTDYYSRPFNSQAEKVIGHNKRMNAKLCLGPRKSLESLLDYAYKFAITMKNVLSFSFIWGSSLTHDFLNLPKKGDKDHKELLEKLSSEKIFDRTILVFMSDHGIRWGGIRKTYQGYLEERLPFLFIAYPTWFRQKYTTAVSNLKRNAHKLTTPYDLHETLLDLVNLTRLEKDVLRTRSQDLGKTLDLPRGISLFLPIPGFRACEDAGIVDHWCTCHQSVNVSPNNAQVRSAAVHLVNHINSLVKDYPHCEKLQLNNITNAREGKSISHKTFETSDVGITDYSLTIETIPGKGLFEGNIRYNGYFKNFTVVGTVSRINLYGDQSKCVSQYRLRLYCFCT